VEGFYRNIIGSTTEDIREKIMDIDLFYHPQKLVEKKIHYKTQ
jgi:hypothetical protein